MSIESLMYTGINGMNTIADNMNVLSENVANINTVSYKGSRSSFQDILTNTYGNMGEVGNGSRLSHVSRSFAVGQFESTTNPTDMGINGKGFFMLRGAADTEANYYTRDGQFRPAASSSATDSPYSLVTPDGYYVQGINLGSVTTPDNTVEDIVIQRQCLPTATEKVTMAVNLSSDPSTIENPDSETNLFSSWDGTQQTPLADNAYDYQTIIKAYDNNGSSFDLTVYFDGTSSATEKEFLVTCDPSLDRRLIGSTGARYNDTSPPTEAGTGALLYGRLIFNPSGQLADVQCWDVPPDGSVDPSEATRRQLGRGEADYTFSYNISGTGDNLSAGLNFGTVAEPQSVISPASARADATGINAPPISSLTAWGDVYDTLGNRAQTGDRITFTGLTGDGTPATLTYEITANSHVSDLLDSLQQTFNCSAVLNNGKLQLQDNTMGQSQLAITATTYTDAAGNTPATNPALAQIFGEENTEFTVQPGQPYAPSTASTTSYNSDSYTIYQHQDGFARGYLESLSVDNKGVITGTYSNGRTIAQAQVMLADFQNYDGLNPENGNRYTAKASAGSRTIGAAQTGALGGVRGNALEMSNVDLAQQFAELILTQRSFQANSASIKTANEIYDVALRLM